MGNRAVEGRISHAWWTVILVVAVTAFLVVCLALFSGTFRSYVPVTLTSQRSGLVMESGAKVKLRGVQVGRVSGVTAGNRSTSLKLELDPTAIKYIPANVGAQIKATTAFGAKYVDLIYPQSPAPTRISAGTVLHSTNVSTEVNTVFENILGVLNQVDPAKLKAVLGAIAEGVRGQGARIGQATEAANRALEAVNPRMGTVQQDFRSLRGFSDAYSSAAQDILTVLDAASTTSATVAGRASELNTLLLSAIGFGRAGTDLLAASGNDLIRVINQLRPTTELLMKYNPEYTCLLQGGKWIIDNGGTEITGGGNGYSVIVDAGVLFGQDPYRYPDNLPIVAAKGGPGGKPGCGSLPDATKNFPVRALVTNTGWGTGLDIRPNPGIGHPWGINYFPVTRGIPEPPAVAGAGPPAIGPVPYPGAPPYGAPLYAPDGTPLYPGVPPGTPAPAPPAPAGPQP